MQIQVYEPLTGDVLTRADVANMKLPFEQGWDRWWVTDADGRVLGQHDNYQAADIQLRILQPLPLAA
ncbi:MULTISPECIES: hypothetical protein [unclassified Mesorhizobium]|uniref:hypothetical protein n=1 Tax=unclassified Mesorhizobium TaxID=325217 RepID=UPI000FDABD04|nr:MULTISPECIES: hypothetical protein [unclassified Mesorhizobium]TGT64029.1 hypothetical protein EN809_034805 [Mesorhizobium sp. M2E.F.Ca.ET.166.01.1.1]TGV97086.1 hypothetical protein EN797_035350 [Mesorhizobium sp. M2E.F.Ca.ET.154.01.1.1]